MIEFLIFLPIGIILLGAFMSAFYEDPNKKEK